MAIKIGVSGFGRISRVVIRAAMDMPEIEIAGINVRNADKEYMVYMLKYDTVFGRFPKELDVYEDGSSSMERGFRCTVKAMQPISLGLNVVPNIS